MKKTEQNLLLLNGLFITSLLVANIVASKIVTLGPLVLPAAVVAYPITFLMTDVIGELWGKIEANRTVRIGFICQISSLVLIGLALVLPVAAFADNQEAFASILGNSCRMVVASMAAYLCSQRWDVWVFHKLRDRYIHKHGSTVGGRWIWNNASTMTSQLIDTAIFITIAFWGKVPNLAVMVLSQYAVKFILAALDTPLFYLMTREQQQ